MLLYLTGKDRVNLLDFVENETGMIPKKMTGKFSLLQFVIRDMRNYAHLKYFVIDRTAVIEDDGGFIEAINSFYTMFNARIIVICEGCSEVDPFLQQLVMAGVTDIVTAAEIIEIQAEILECLSPEGMKRYKAPKQEPSTTYVSAESIPTIEKYTFNCNNIRIAVAGCQRRVGVTTTAVNLTYWIKDHGGTACYVENNRHQHLAYIIKLYTDQPEGNHYTINGVDYYLTDEFDKTYNFIITDCGELNEPPQASFAKADLRLLCGSAMPYELAYMQNAINRCKGMMVQALGMCVPLDIRELLQQAISNDILFVDSSHELFDGNTNGKLSKELVSNYITGTIDGNKAVQEL